MASLRKSRFSADSSHDSKRSGRGVSNRPAPIQVAKSVVDNTWGDKSEAAVPETNHVAEFSLRSEVILSDRLNELAKLESPLLRELAQRLGSRLNIESPRVQQKFKHPYADLHVGDRWEAVQGCYGWKGLLEPSCDEVLRAEILRYGEFSQATYDAFDHDKLSKHYGTCKYLKTDLLEKVGLENRGYEITKFLYATTNLSLYPHFLVGPPEDTKDITDNTDASGAKSSNSTMRTNQAHDFNCKGCGENSRQCNWQGFVAVCTSPEEIARLGRRDIVIAWRGSVTKFDWIADMMDYMSPAEFGPDVASSKVRVEKGFFHLYTSTNPKSRYCHTKSARDQVHDAIRTLVTKYKDDGKLSITLTGHSLGSALATLCAYDIAECQVDILTPTVSSEWHATESRPKHGGMHEEQLSRLYHHSSIFSKDALPNRANPREYADGERRGSQSFKKVFSRQNQFVDKFRRERIPVTVYSFGGPRVGNRPFADRMEELGVAVLRVVNVHDKVTKVPGFMRHHLKKKLSQIVSQLPSYKHVGVKLTVDNELSEVLQKPAGLSRAHCLEGYLHLVDSYQGTNRVEDEKTLPKKIVSCTRSYLTRNSKYTAYKKTFRDPALVNKYKDYLKPDLAIPPCWWQEKNKGLIIKANGEWGLPDRDESVPITPPEEEESEEFDRTIDAACERSSPHQKSPTVKVALPV